MLIPMQPLLLLSLFVKIEPHIFAMKGKRNSQGFQLMLILTIFLILPTTRSQKYLAAIANYLSSFFLRFAVFPPKSYQAYDHDDSSNIEQATNKPRSKFEQ